MLHIFLSISLFFGLGLHITQTNSAVYKSTDIKSKSVIVLEFEECSGKVTPAKTHSLP